MQLDKPVECTSGGDPLPLYKILHLLFSPLVWIICALCLESRKKLSTWSWCSTFGISVSLAEGMSHQPVRNSVALFRGQRQNTRSQSSVIILLQNFCLHRPLRLCLGKMGLILPFARVSRNVEQNVHTTFSFPNPLSESEVLEFWGCSKIMLSFLMQFDSHFWPNQQQQQCLPQLESILEGHLSHHPLQASFCLKNDNTT